MSVVGGAFIIAGSITNLASNGDGGLALGLLLLGTIVGALGISVAHRG